MHLTNTLKQAFYLTIYMMVLCLFSNAQSKRSNIWHFGYNIGLDFNSGTPSIINSPTVSTMYSCASISDDNGDLLFYTYNGIVLNKNHQLMPSGNVLNGNSNSLIVPKPGNSNLYYLLHNYSAVWNGAKGLQYSEIDMNLDGGLGDITTNKNIQLVNKTCEKLASVMHQNGTDVWVITHEYDSDLFYAYLVTNTGVSTPITSKIGSVITGMDSYGQLKFSPDGKKLVAIYHKFGQDEIATGPNVYLYDFNAQTGIVSNEIALKTASDNGASFSPNNQYLYYLTHTYFDILTSTTYPDTLIQYDISSNNSTSIEASKTVIYIDEEPDYPEGGPFQIASDGKIYIATPGNNTFLGVINCPNTKGPNCDYKKKGFTIPFSIPMRTTGQYNLPNFIESYFNGIPNPSSCPQSTTVALNTEQTNIKCNGICNGEIIAYANSGTEPYTYNWQPVAKTSNIATGLCAGTYTVKVTDANGSSATKVITITEPSPLSVYIDTKNDTCAQSIGSISVSVSGGSSPFRYLWSNNSTEQQITNLSANNYYLLITDSNGCKTNRISTVENESTTMANAGIDVTINKGDSIQLNGTGTPINATYKWIPNNSLSDSTTKNPFAKPSVTTTYTLIVSDGNSCTSIDVVTITIETDCSNNNVFIPNGFSPNGDGNNDVIFVRSNCIKTMNFTIYNRWGELVFESTNIASGWDGTFNGNTLNSEIFAYFIDATMMNGEIYSSSGNISLIK